MSRRLSTDPKMQAYLDKIVSKDALIYAGLMTQKIIMQSEIYYFERRRNMAEKAGKQDGVEAAQVMIAKLEEARDMFQAAAEVYKATGNLKDMEKELGLL